jgi:Protein kinase domain
MQAVQLLELPLKQAFCYMHEPLRTGDTAIPLLGNADLATELRNRILHSRGGAFLITGFRGVGKSTVVLRALEALDGADGGREIVVPVVISVARPTDTDRLLFAVVRRLFESLNDRGFIERLSPDTRRSLLLAYQRTSLAFRESRTDSREQSATAGGGGGAALKMLVPTAAISAKRTRSLATEAQFLAYSETDVEHDIMRIVTLLEQEGQISPIRHGFLRWRLWPRAREIRSRIRLAVVLDEVDKLTDDANGISSIETLLGGTKNVLTMGGVHFIVVAGPDLHDRVVSDVAHGNSVYESVFGWRAYVPCCWDAVDLLLEGVLGEAPGQFPEDLKTFRDYLRFKARGIPRRLLQEFNDFVEWDSDHPVLRVKPRDARRITFYARLEQSLDQYRERSERSSGLFPVAVDEDRRRLGAYYVIDWVLRSEGDSFRAVDLINRGQAAYLDPVLHVSLSSVERLLEHLAENGIVEIARKPSVGQTMYGGIEESDQVVYRLADEVMQVLLSLADRSETERAALAIPAPTESTTMGRRVLGGRYEIVRRLGQGGMSEVVLGRDRILGRPVAIKMAPAFVNADREQRARFRREAEVTSRLEHPQIVRCYDVIDTDTTLALILEFVDGRELSTTVQSVGPLPANETVFIARAIAEALDYLEQHQVVRIDLKPNNVMIHPTRGPILIDFGVAKALDLPSMTLTGQIIGTPLWMAPEQFQGAYDHRSDIRALGLIMYYCLMGREPVDFKGDMAEVIRHVLEKEVDVSGLRVSDELRTAIFKATRISPDQRYQHARDLVSDLERTPEASRPPTEKRSLWDSQVDVELDANNDHTKPLTILSPYKKSRASESGGEERGTRETDDGKS